MRTDIYLETDRSVFALREHKKSHAGIYVPLAVIFLMVLCWIVIRPGVYTVEPNNALPEGMTVIYYGRGAGMPFFSSPDRVCLQIQGSVSEMCRMEVLAQAADLTNRILLQLPYVHWAYLRSTGGVAYGQ
jgi:hypothetical protein